MFKCKMHEAIFTQLGAEIAPIIHAALFSVQYLILMFWQQIATNRSKAKATISQVELSVAEHSAVTAHWCDGQETNWELYTGNLI